MKICFIWHMHQPFYKDLKTGEYLMPWVRLHSCKDYLDMLLILDDFPGIKQTFNLVPSLIEQISDYVENSAEDRHLHLSRRPASELRDSEKEEVVSSFFSAHPETMIKPYPRYAELLEKAKRKGRAWASFSEQELLDLQVWSNAVWIDPMFRSEDAVKRVFSKGRNFTEDDKRSVLDFQINLMGRIVPAYKERLERGRIEVSFSPFYHPILPLLVDSESAKMALPSIKLPKHRFAHPEDAEEQIARAVAMYQDLFGRELVGMWPSEGSVSEAILPLLARHGIKWIATDEEVYLATRNLINGDAPPASGRENSFHRPFKLTVDGSDVGILFRDHKLSDKIGFVYAGWEPERAADDFIKSLKQLQKVLADEPNAVVAVILDGENAWEYYRNDGQDFLRCLYRKLEKDARLQSVLPAELFTDGGNTEPLPRLFAGSWINHNFAVWIGHDEDNRAWDLLKLTRDRLVEREKSESPPSPETREFCWKEILIAEGSDWCWWYGDDHHTDHFDTFDYLFRKHLLNIWEALGDEPPLALRHPLRKAMRPVGVHEPSDILAPLIDGRQTSYFEWFGAGRVECSRMGGAMHRGESQLYQILFGYDDKHLYFRVDFDREKRKDAAALSVEIEVAEPKKFLVRVSRKGWELLPAESAAQSDTEKEIQVKWDEIIEVAVPRSLLGETKNATVYFCVSLSEGEKIVERWPNANYITFELPKPGETPFWQV